ncbi:PepSY-like domain-containing protein [uncultured Parabacteroides sp.]|uniref:PepSY-like domain-containing protein n=1 Tax=uncultured Parabacteroides sp. TaxID=512312 RepID=UPI00258E4AD3|nr:PepSY-like domain-containing protein [uncultured Parabacteroides sp.]
MKKSISIQCLLLSLFCITFFGGCSNDDDENLKTKQLPIEAQNFLTYHLPDQSPSKIEKITSTDPENGDNYKVYFLDDLSITFNQTGDWLNITSPNSTFPGSLNLFFSGEESEYIRKNYPNDPIIGITPTFFGNIFTLQSSKELAFQTYQCIFLGETLDINSLDELPISIKQFISHHFPEAKYQTVIKNTSINEDADYNYIVWLNGNIKLEFDINNNWKELNGYGKLLPTSIIESLPTKVKEYLTNRYPDAQITSILLTHSTRYTIRISQTLQVVIDPERENTTIEIDKINEFVNKYFTGITSKSISVPFDYITLIINVNLSNGFDITMNKYYQWLTINGNGYPFPEALLSVLPDEINQYIAINAKEEITKVETVDYGYRIVLTNGEGVKFDFKGKYLGNEDIPITPYDKTYKYMRYHFPENLYRPATFIAGSGWTYTLSDGTKIAFDLEGNLINN